MTSAQQEQTESYQRKEPRFTNKVVIVTGSSAGIGADAALGFGREGAAVVIHGRNEERLEKTARALREAGVPESKICRVLGSMEDDSTAERIVKAAIEKFGRIDILVNNAGSTSMLAEFERNSMALCDHMYRVNFRAAAQLTQLAAPHLVAARGSVVNVSSVTAQRVTSPMDAFYGSMKAALDQFTRLSANLYGPQGVRVNAVAPGYTDTLIVAEERYSCLQPTFVGEYAAMNTPMGRVGLPHEVAAVVLFLASHEAAYVTGCVWVVDGGLLVKELPRPQVDPAYWTRSGKPVAVAKEK